MAITGLLAVVAAGSAYSAYESGQSAKASKKQAGIAEDVAAKNEAEAIRLRDEEKRNKKQAYMKIKKRRGATSEGGARGTILTSQLGRLPEQQTANKTLLGA